jgi:hypothetical protein
MKVLLMLFVLSSFNNNAGIYTSKNQDIVLYEDIVKEQKVKTYHALQFLKTWYEFYMVELGLT